MAQSESHYQPSFKRVEKYSSWMGRMWNYRPKGPGSWDGGNAQSLNNIPQPCHRWIAGPRSEGAESVQNLQGSWSTRSEPQALWLCPPPLLYKVPCLVRVTEQHFDWAAWEAKAKEALVSCMVILSFLLYCSSTQQCGCPPPRESGTAACFVSHGGVRNSVPKGYVGKNWLSGLNASVWIQTLLHTGCNICMNKKHKLFKPQLPPL